MIRRNWFLGAELERNGIDVTRCLRSRLLHRIGDLCPCLPCTVCPLGSCGSLPNQVASGVAVAACRFAVLGNPYRGSSLAVLVDDAGKLTRETGWSSALSGRISAPFFGFGRLRRYFCNAARQCRCGCLLSESHGLRLENLRRPQQFVMIESPRDNGQSSRCSIGIQISRGVELTCASCEFMCLDCHKGFLKTLTSHDYEERVVTCPHCGSSRVELRITLPAKAKRKSA